MQHKSNNQPTNFSFLRQSLPFPFWLRGLVILIIFFVSAQYFQTKFYHFPEPTPFQGDSLYNPYKTLSGKWLKSNFHTHAKAWGGLTNGRQPGDEIVRKYRNYKYDIACVSDYHAVNSLQNKQHPLYVPVYEHGINIHKAHRLAIGTEEVSYYDIPLFQNQSTKQYLVDRLKEKAPVVCIAHPSVQESHSPKVLQNLSGYDCLEVLNRGRVATTHWDAALSAGKPVWILGNDDCHDVTKSGFATSWTMVHTQASIAEDVLHALKRGKTYGVYNKKEKPFRQELLSSIWRHKENILKEVTTHATQLTIDLRQKADTIRLIGQGGMVKKEMYHAHSVTYNFTASDTYIRAEIIRPEANYYLNPVMRYDGQSAPQNYHIASTDVWLTFLWRYTIVVVNFLCICAFFKQEISILLHGQRQSFPQPVLVNN